jgi:chromosome segregation ATPase
MSTISEVVDSLENRISKLLHRHEKLKEANSKLESQIQNLKSQQDQSSSEIEDLRAKCNSLKLANSMLGSDQHKRETKLKINALVREIDNCISQLSE